ncbi:ABC transporter substrate-binding protein [Methylobacterium sp. E-045]|uniref:ABC transporter substrate-binding protein n=1 Tax=Methylobacterium sp. E-045 TaxID=2836575 RepID=UPI001FB89608|nr:hypothetical protein [Methylobacterium sp. E-045]MCJ2128155.1 hypothetical protein [Methylobacterium sp. E-045]
MQRRQFLVGSSLAVGAFSGLAPIRSRSQERIKVTLGYQSLWAGGGSVFETLKHTNILELHGVDASFKTFTYGGPLAEAAVAGAIDNIFAADAPTLRAMARIPGSKVLQRTHDQRFAVIARPDFIGDLADLRGKRLSGPFATTVFPRCIQAIIAAGVREPFKEIRIVNQDVAEQADAMRAGAVDAVTSWDPTFENLIRQKLGRVVWQAPLGAGSGIQGFSGPWLQRYGQDGAVQLLKAWISATWWTSRNIDQADAWFSKTSRLDPQILTAADKADRYLRSPVAEIKTLDFLISAQEIQDTQGVIDFLHDQKLLTNRIEAAPFYDMAPLERAQREIAAGDHVDLSRITITA